MVWPCCILMACGLLPCVSPACSLGSKRYVQPLGCSGTSGSLYWKSAAAAGSRGGSELPQSCPEDWNAQIRSREGGLQGKIPTAARGPDKHGLKSFCSGSPRCRHKNLPLGSDKKNGPAEDLRTHKVLQNAAIVLAVIPEIGRLRVLLHFVGQILTLALPCDRREEAIDAAFLESVQLNLRHNKGRNQMIYNYSLRLTNYTFSLAGKFSKLC